MLVNLTNLRWFPASPELPESYTAKSDLENEFGSRITSGEMNFWFFVEVCIRQGHARRYGRTLVRAAGRQDAVTRIERDFPHDDDVQWREWQGLSEGSLRRTTGAVSPNDDGSYWVEVRELQGHASRWGRTTVSAEHCAEAVAQVEADFPNDRDIEWQAWRDLDTDATYTVTGAVMPAEASDLPEDL